MRRDRVLGPLALLVLALACGSSEEPKHIVSNAPPESEPQPEALGLVAPPAPADLPRALVLALAQFEDEVDPKTGKTLPVPGAARLEFLVRKGGAWHVTSLEDPESNALVALAVAAEPLEESVMVKTRVIASQSHSELSFGEPAATERAIHQMKGIAKRVFFEFVTDKIHAEMGARHVSVD